MTCWGLQFSCTLRAEPSTHGFKSSALAVCERCALVLVVLVGDVDANEKKVSEMLGVRFSAGRRNLHRMKEMPRNSPGCGSFQIPSLRSKGGKFKFPRQRCQSDTLPAYIFDSHLRYFREVCCYSP